MSAQTHAHASALIDADEERRAEHAALLLASRINYALSLFWGLFSVAGTSVALASGWEQTQFWFWFVLGISLICLPLALFMLFQAWAKAPPPTPPRTAEELRRAQLASRVAETRTSAAFVLCMSIVGVILIAFGAAAAVRADASALCGFFVAGGGVCWLLAMRAGFARRKWRQTLDETSLDQEIASVA